MRAGLCDLAPPAAFLGATTYIGLVEQPARLALGSRAMIKEWTRRNRRGTLMFAILAVVLPILAYIQFRSNGDVRWLIGGATILASWPYAYFVMVPVNVWLCTLPGTAPSPVA